ncbi:phage tail protein [Aureimonas leprariae]|uniref:Phage tail protein n=1 Tax=Plantimonas leprariae TaxID=2615207 RepID=A0A7V7PRE9_9HYPH|nr:phage tail protein [Aureimonas leprariae]KAB0681333.1 phage tail protein [Aureimonas leprariae]
MPEEKAAAAIGQVTDPYRNFNFKLEIRGLIEGHFTGCSGLGARIQPIRYREGGTSQVVRAIPGPVDYAEVTLSYGVTRSNDLWDWFSKGVTGRVERRNVSIILLEPNGVDEALRWNLIDAWPSEWSGAPLDALGREIAVEQVKLVFDSVGRA